jgi:hypothetical protein
MKVRVRDDLASPPQMCPSLHDSRSPTPSSRRAAAPTSGELAISMGKRYHNEHPFSTWPVETVSPEATAFTVPVTQRKGYGQY